MHFKRAIYIRSRAAAQLYIRAGAKRRQAIVEGAVGGNEVGKDALVNRQET